MLGIGLIGLGKHGSRYARHIVEDLTDAALVAVCRRNRTEGKKLAAAYRCAFHDDYHDLVANPGVDAVVVAVPPLLHPAIVEAACRAGKPLLVEKPLATSLAAAQRIASLVSTSGVRAMVAHTLRFNRTVQTVRTHVPEIGPLHALYLSQRFEPSPLDWLDRRAESGGGIVLHTGVHSFDLLSLLTGCEVTRVWCRTAQIITRETEDSFAMTCQLSNPSLLATIAGSRAMGGRVGLVELAGARGHLLADHVHGFVHLVRGTERLTLPVPSPVPTVRETLDAFVRALREAPRFLSRSRMGCGRLPSSMPPTAQPSAAGRRPRSPDSLARPDRSEVEKRSRGIHSRSYLACGWLQGPATTEIDSPHLRGGGRLTGEPACAYLRSVPPASTGGNPVNRRENLVGKWESDRISPKPAPGPAWVPGT